MIPGDGTVIEGIASVDESAVTGESAPVIREAGGDRSAVTGGTRVLSDRIVVEITQEPGKSFLDRMIALVEGASRRKTPNEIALGILLAGLTLVFLVVVVTLRPYRHVRRHRRLDGDPDRAAGGADPDHDRRPALGDRDRRHGPARAPQRARALRAARSRPPATSTCCCSTRPARSRSATARRPSSCPMPGRDRGRARRGRPVRLARRRDAGGPLDRGARQAVRDPRARARRRTRSFVPFTAETRMSGVDLDGSRIRKGAGDAIIELRRGRGRPGAARSCASTLDRIAREGGTPLAVAATRRCSASSTSRT